MLRLATPLLIIKVMTPSGAVLYEVSVCVGGLGAVAPVKAARGRGGQFVVMSVHLRHLTLHTLHKSVSYSIIHRLLTRPIFSSSAVCQNDNCSSSTATDSTH
jgi:hypothetical protein